MEISCQEWWGYEKTCLFVLHGFDNGQIIFFQDNFKYFRDVPFTVCFDFETTRGEATGGCCFWPKNNGCELMTNLFISSVPKSR